MTRARALKTAIRTRAARTGERYTTARRHVVKALETTAPVTSRAVPQPAQASAPAPAKGTISDAKSIERTGHDLAYWFDVLDRYDARGKGHTAAARHLREAHGVDGWYSQGITVSYERARGLRAPNQRTSGEYEVSVSKVVAADVATVVAMFKDKRRRTRWAAHADPDLAAALAAAFSPRASKGFGVRSNGLASCSCRWDSTRFQIYAEPRPGRKSSVVVASRKLLSREVLETRRAQWRAALASLAASLSK